MTSFADLRRKIKRNKFLQFGMPMITLTVLASVAMTELTATKIERRDYRNREVTTAELLDMAQKKTPGKAPVDIRKEFEKMQQTVEDDYVMKPLPPGTKG
eukprot:Colp12_sorted_trinity150504_noHs@25838